MRVTHLPATPAESAAVRAAQMAVFTKPRVLDPDADLAPPLPVTGGVPGDWVTAAGWTPDGGVTIYVHGGGFAHTNPSMGRIIAHRLSQATGRAAFRVDYRLAPAHPFPAAVEDVVAVYRSLLGQGVPAERVLLAGESAGGTLVLSAPTWCSSTTPRGSPKLLPRRASPSISTCTRACRTLSTPPCCSRRPSTAPRRGRSCGVPRSGRAGSASRLGAP